MLRRTVAILFLLCCSTSVLARESSDPAGTMPIRVLSADLLYQDAHATNPWLNPGPPLFTGTTGGAVLGLGGTYRHGLGQGDWRLKLGGSLQLVGGSSQEVSGNTFEERFSGWSGRLGVDYVHRLNDRLSIYGGGSLFYSGTKSTWKDDDDEFEGEPFKMLGFEPAIGCEHWLGGRTGFFGEFYSQFGKGSTEVGETKYSEWIKYGCWRGGLLMQF